MNYKNKYQELIEAIAENTHARCHDSCHRGHLASLELEAEALIKRIDERWVNTQTMNLKFTEALSELCDEMIDVLSGYADESFVGGLPMGADQDVAKTIVINFIHGNLVCSSLCAKFVASNRGHEFFSWVAEGGDCSPAA